MRESRRITRKSASNLALAFVMLPREKREAMSALYAFCREVDDVADEDTVDIRERKRRLDSWRGDIQRACAGVAPEMAVNLELAPVILKYRLPLELFQALLDGVEMDLEKRRYADWEELDLYCYRVASVVGLLSIRIFGSCNPDSEAYAVHLGKALQLTNILRDVRADSLRGRIYLPQTELRSHCVAEQEILDGRWSDRYAALGGAIADRAEQHYREARRRLRPQDRGSMIASELMGAVYWRLLGKLRGARFNVFEGKPLRLSKPCKAALVLRAWIAFKVLGAIPAYGRE